MNQLQACSVRNKALSKCREHSRSGEKRSPAARVSPYTSFVFTSLAACFISNGARLKLVYLLNNKAIAHS